jgi:hypothetical protein
MATGLVPNQPPAHIGTYALPGRLDSRQALAGLTVAGLGGEADGHRFSAPNPGHQSSVWAASGVQRDPGPTPTKAPRPESSPTVASAVDPQQDHSTDSALGPRSPTTGGMGAWAASGVRLTARPCPLHQPVMERNARPLPVTLHNATLTTTSARRADSQMRRSRCNGSTPAYHIPRSWTIESHDRVLLVSRAASPYRHICATCGQVTGRPYCRLCAS